LTPVMTTIANNAAAMAAGTIDNGRADRFTGTHLTDCAYVCNRSKLTLRLAKVRCSYGLCER